jgi:DNA-binding XRE family transcriptional regulator
MSKPPIDFVKVESLRNHMLISQANMAKLLGVSRMTYYSWISGRAIRKSNEATVRELLKKLLAVVTTHGWPTPEVHAMQANYRMQKLSELIKAYEEKEGA